MNPSTVQSHLTFLGLLLLFFFTARVAVAVHACACMSATVFSQHDVAECAVNNKKHEEAGEGGGRRRKRRRRIGTHSIPEHDVHTKLPTVMSV